VFAGLGWLVLSETALRSREEVLYHLSPTLSQCVSASGKEHCVAEYRLALANSGLARQDLVEVRWPADFAAWQVGWSTTDLVGSTRARAEPDVRTRKDGALAHEVRNLDPNTLLELTLRCEDCTRAQLEAARHAEVQVLASGKVLEREPRTTMLGRAAANAGRLLGIFF